MCKSTVIASLILCWIAIEVVHGVAIHARDAKERSWVRKMREAGFSDSEIGNTLRVFHKYNFRSFTTENQRALNVSQFFVYN